MNDVAHIDKTTGVFSLTIRNQRTGTTSISAVGFEDFDSAVKEVNWYCGIDEDVLAAPEDRTRLQKIGESWHLHDGNSDREFVVKHTRAPLKAEVKTVDLKTCADPTDGDNIGVFAQAQIIFAKPEGGSIIGPIIRSAGVWGVEVDTNTELDFLRELGEEEFSALEDMLKALGLAMPQEYSQTLFAAPFHR